jgi:GAF domain-containing protein/HAMP domain-containing protein
MTNFFHPRTLRDKFRTPIIGLMVISLLASVLAFSLSIVLTQNQLLRRQAESSSEKITQILQARVLDLETATQLLANDPEVLSALQASNEETLEILNRRAVVVRERFQLGLVQIYNASGIPRTNLLLSSLYRETSLLDQIQPGTTVARVINDQAILLSRVDTPGALGTVVLGVDLGSEIDSLLARYRLSAEMGLRFMSYPGSGAPAIQMQIATSENFPFDAPRGRSSGIYKHELSLMLGETPVDLLLIHSTSDLQHIASTGVFVMLISTVVTTGLLIILSTTVMRILVQPIQQISHTADAIAKGDFSQRIMIPPDRSWLSVGHNDEIGSLTASFNTMVGDLEDLYTHMEARVTARTHELSVAADLARSVSSSSDVTRIIQMSVQLLRQRLNFHRVALFTVDGRTQQAVLREVSGEIGEYGQGHTIPLRIDTLVGAAAAIHTAAIVPDVSLEKRLTHDWLPQAQAGLAVPLLFGQDVIGVLEIQSLTVDAFPPEMTQLLNTLADQIAMGLHNAQLYADEQKRRRIAEVLELTGRVLTGSLDIEELPGRALVSLNVLIKYERSSLWMQEGEHLKPLAQYGYGDLFRLQGKKLTVHGDIYNHLKTERQPLMIADVMAEPHWQQRPWLSGDRTWLGVPIIARGNVIGMLCLTRREPEGFDTEDVPWVQSFAAQLGIALENANLYAQAVRVDESLTQVQKERVTVPVVNWPPVTSTSSARR